MSLRQKIVLLTVLPMLLGMLIVSVLVIYQARQLSDVQATVFYDELLEVHKSELQRHTRMARSALSPILKDPQLTEFEKQERARTVLSELAYADDGYFFAYTSDGVNLVHPKQPYRIGKNWWNLTDSEGKFIIQELIDEASKGGGFTNYLWEQPSSGEITRKLGYAEMLHEWQWMFGSGVYIGDIDKKSMQLNTVFDKKIKSTSIVIIAIAVAAVVVVILCSLALQISELKSADSKLRLLTKRVIDTQDEERSRVSRELHDGVNQRLVAIKYSLEEAQIAASNSQSNIVSLIQTSEDHIDDTIVEVKRMSRDLHPSILDDLGLMVAVESLVEQFMQRTGIEVELIKVPFRNLLEKRAKTALYRVTQEAFTNIERHAQATNVRVAFELNIDLFRLTISDNGIGFDNAIPANSSDLGLGLRNMSERISYFKGSFDITTSGNGTTIVASLPRSTLSIVNQANQGAA